MNKLSDYEDKDIAYLTEDSLYQGTTNEKVDDALKGLDILADSVDSNVKAIDAQTNLNDQLISTINNLTHRVNILENIISSNLPKVRFH